MKNDQLATLVAVHNLPINWLAKHVGRVSERSFRYWMHGRAGAVHSVPADVLERLQCLNQAIDRALENTNGSANNSRTKPQAEAA